jgi:hypothetical protein
MRQSSVKLARDGRVSEARDRSPTGINLSLDLEREGIRSASRAELLNRV